MTRRKFFSAVVGFSSGIGVVVAFRSCYTPKVEFPPEKILEIDEEGKVYQWEPQFMLSYDPKTRTILSVRIEEGPIR